METNQYILVDSEVLPEVFHKVLQAKNLLAKGTAKSSSEACKMVDISRGAFYKYRDRIFIYDERMSNEITTFQLLLEDEPGILSQVLTCLYAVRANVLTVNQNIPNDKVAVVTISIRPSSDETNRVEMTESLKRINGVIDVKII